MARLAAKASEKEGTEPAPGVAPALAAHDLGFRLSPDFALEGISFALRPGQFAVLLGLNGAGKTTLFSLLTRLYEGRQGEIRIFGRELRHHSSFCLSQMGVVFQQSTLDLDLSVERNLLYHAALHGLAKREAVPRIETLLTGLGLGARRREKVRRLNSGHRRRVEIARALVHRPRLLLLDEATSGLDVPTRRQLVDHVHGLCRSEGLAALWATHLIDEVAEDDAVILLHRGRILFQGSPAELRRAGDSSSLGDAFLAVIGNADTAR